MRKEKIYDRSRFNADVIAAADRKLEELSSQQPASIRRGILTVEHDDAIWKYDELQEFLADYRRFRMSADYLASTGELEMRVFVKPSYTSITVSAPSRTEIETIFSIFEGAASTSRLPDPPVPEGRNPVPNIFIGHGRSGQWRDLKDHLQDKHGFQIEAYETGARAGHTIRDVLEDMAAKSTFALLVLTAEDDGPEGSIRARQNVIHEAGLFQGRLGFARALMLLEEGVELFSNVQGIQYISFSKGNIKETFGEVLATLKREFPR
ncbi:MAG: nucleotide-binding protein [Methylococcales bacterium]|nr:nucleotide-binding protein [Methylococcales bacterium]